MKTKYIIQDREAGNRIESFDSVDDAERALHAYEQSDKQEGIYIENFYEIIEKE